MPIAAEDFPDAVDRLCTAARRSSNIRLEFDAPRDEFGFVGHRVHCTETEPLITHLLVCAMAQLGGERPLACVKHVRLKVRLP